MCSLARVRFKGGLTKFNMGYGTEYDTPPIELDCAMMDTEDVVDFVPMLQAKGGW